MSHHLAVAFVPPMTAIGSISCQQTSIAFYPFLSVSIGVHRWQKFLFFLQTMLHDKTGTENPTPGCRLEKN
ncbi:MAG: hypothetical protein Q8O00_04305, partial [Holophaga sp.]|nr:hypothetical protein [Holophaga sp.]